MNASVYAADLKDLVHGICAVPAGLDTRVYGIQLDSRKIQKGDLFIALSGQKSAAHYVSDALKNGAGAVLIEKDLASSGLDEKAHEDQGAVELVVDNLRALLGTIADRFFKEPSASVDVIGVTGTNGKTSVSSYIAQLLHLNGIKSGVIGTLGFGLIDEGLVATNYTTPDVVEVHRSLAALRDAGAKCVVMEVSSHGLEQGRVDGVRFEGAVFTNLSREHLDYHGSMDQYAKAKQKLFEKDELKYAVLNADDALAQTYQDVLAEHVNLFTYGIDNEAVIKADQVSLEQGIQANIRFDGSQFSMHSPLLGLFNLSNLLAVIAVGVARNFNKDALVKVNDLKAVPGRMELLTLPNKPTVVIDYAHTPDAIKNALLALRAHCKGMLTVVFGCGGDRDQGKRSEMAAIAEAHADKIVVTDDNPRTESPEAIVADILSGFIKADTVQVIHDRAAAIQAAIETSGDDLVLIAGKGHEDYQEVNGERLPFSDSDVVKRCLGISKGQEVYCD